MCFFVLNGAVSSRRGSNYCFLHAAPIFDSLYIYVLLTIVLCVSTYANIRCKGISNFSLRGHDWTRKNFKRSNTHCTVLFWAIILTYVSIESSGRAACFYRWNYAPVVASATISRFFSDIADAHSCALFSLQTSLHAERAERVFSNGPFFSWRTYWRVPTWWNKYWLQLELRILWDGRKKALLI